MFLYKALKHRDEEEDIQVRSEQLGGSGPAVGSHLKKFVYVVESLLFIVGNTGSL